MHLGAKGTGGPAVFFIVGVLVSCEATEGDCTTARTCLPSISGSSGTAGTSGTSDAGSPTGGGSENGGSSPGTSGTTGAGGGGGAGGAAGCEGDVSDDASCWATSELGVFVSSEYGDDATADGSKDFPYKTLSKGIAGAGGKNVYVCVGTDDYRERVSLDNPTSEVRVYGGFECEGWTYDTARRAQVISPSNIALRLQGISRGVYIENVEFVAADGSGEDASSYGAFITDSKNVTFKRVALRAGKGLAGIDGKDGEKGENGKPPQSEQVGADALCSASSDGEGGIAVASSCGSKGGNGGSAIVNDTGLPGANGLPQENVTPPSFLNGGTRPTDGSEGGEGQDGSPGNAGSAGEAAAASGAFTVTGFTPASGSAGGSGYPGQGGGGGGASKGGSGCRGAAGGAGGQGGCGGGGGSGGGGGGASVGLFSWESKVTLEDCEVSSATGGAGGKGGKGGGIGSGAIGGAGGNATDNGTTVFASGGQGGRGGNGGAGGPGSGGTGGPSYALVFSGTRPTSDASTNWIYDSGGEAGKGATTGSGAPDGSSGASGPELEVP